MKRKIAVGIVLMGGGIFLSTKAFAQASPVVVETGSSILNPVFFVAILAGVLIALGFQLVLTNLSMAAGISAVGDIRKKIHSRNKEPKETPPQKPDKDEHETPLAVKLFSAAGAWGMITGIISLFFACFFAVKLSLVDHNGVGVALGLAIWAVFFMTMFYLESKGIGALINGISSAAIGAIKAAISGAGSILSGTGSLFRKSETAKTESIVNHTVDRIADKIENAIDESDIGHKLTEYLNKLIPQPVDIHQVKDELENLLNDLHILQKNGNIPGERELILSVAEKDSRFSKEDVGTIDKLLDVGKSALKVAGAVAGTGGFASMIAGYFQKGKHINVSQVKHEAEDYILRNEPRVDPEIVRDELDEIFSNESMEKIKAHQIDKEYVAAIVAERKGYDRQEALDTVDRVEEALNRILRESNIMEIAGSKVSDVKNNILSQAEERVRKFFDKINRPELNYELLKSEFEFIMHHPNLAPEVLKRKLKQLDKKTLMAVLSANTRFSPGDVQNISLKFDEAKDNVMSKLEASESAIKGRMDQAKEVAIEQAENTRKTAAAASWWLLATLVLTGLASALGGMMAL